MDRAVGSFLGLASESPGEPRLWTDLSAAYFERAKAADDPDDLLRALDAVERAVPLAPAAEEPLFNRGLILDALALRENSRETWNGYLRLDPSSPWAEEARARLAATAEAAGGGIQDARVHILEEALPGWGRPLAEGPPAGRGRLLEELRRIAESVADFPGDRSVPDAVAVAESLMDSVETARRAARGRLAFSRGMRLYRESRDTAAASAFQNAQTLLAGTDDPTRLWASVQLGWLAMYRGEYSAALRHWQAVERECAGRPYPALLGRVHWGRGAVALRTGDFELAAREYSKSRARFEQAQEELNGGALEYLVAENLDNLGRQREASRAMLRALRSLRQYPSSVWRHQLLRFAGIRARELGMPEASRVLLDEGVSAARSTGQHQYVAEALLWRGEALRTLGRFDEARDDLLAAERAWRQMPVGGMADRIAADLRAAQAELARVSGSVEALPLYDAALEYFEGLALETGIPQLLLGRAGAQAAQGDRQGALADLEAAARLFREQGQRIQDNRSRIGHRETTVRYFDSMIDLSISAGDPHEALDLATRSREVLTPDVESVCRVRQIQGGVLKDNEDLGVLHYAKTETGLFAWLITSDTVRQRQIPSEPTEARLGTMLATLNGGRSRSVARALYELLVAPFDEELDSLTALTIVPDKELAWVPWAALEQPASGRLLLHSLTVSFAPSLCLREPPSAHRPFGPTTSVAVVVDPQLDARDYPSFGALPGAATEAEGIQGLYEGATVLTGTVYEEDLLELLREHEIVHFIGHVEHNRRHPELSFLALSSTDSATGALQAREILGLDLGGLRLAVLAACDTLVSRPGRADVLLGLASSFLAAGTEAVVATQWPVDDLAAAEVMTSFHRALAGGSPPAEALRQAQLKAHRKGMSPRDWAAFQVWTTRPTGRPRLRAGLASSSACAEAPG